MIAADVQRAFEAFLTRRGIVPAHITPPVALDQMADFWRFVKFDGVGSASDADMLLFQYGVYDFGQGLSFRLDITRQIIREEALGDDDIVQLSLVLHYAPSSFASIGDFNRWSIDAPSMAAFVDDAKTTAGYLQASRAVPLRVEIGASTV